jgi:hypothetical protein
MTMEPAGSDDDGREQRPWTCEGVLAAAGPRWILTIVAVLVGVVWVAIGSLGLIALVDSPLHCPLTMGCIDRKPKECSSWGGFMQSATTRGSCDGSR